jgi:hypothetical protein
MNLDSNNISHHDRNQPTCGGSSEMNPMSYDDMINATEPLSARVSQSVPKSNRSSLVHKKKHRSTRHKKSSPKTSHSSASCGKMWIRPIRDDQKMSSPSKMNPLIHKRLVPSSYQGIRTDNALQMTSEQTCLGSPITTHDRKGSETSISRLYFYEPPSDHHKQRAVAFGESGRLIKPIGNSMHLRSRRIHQFLLCNIDL